jgi:hypothetical protein
MKIDDYIFYKLTGITPKECQEIEEFMFEQE